MPKKGKRKAFAWHLNLRGSPLHFQLKMKVTARRAAQKYLSFGGTVKAVVTEHC
jgi:hypothetical protein